MFAQIKGFTPPLYQVCFLSPIFQNVVFLKSRDSGPEKAGERHSEVCLVAPCRRNRVSSKTKFDSPCRVPRAVINCAVVAAGNPRVKTTTRCVFNLVETVGFRWLRRLTYSPGPVPEEWPMCLRSPSALDARCSPRAPTLAPTGNARMSTQWSSGWAILPMTWHWQ